MKIFKLSAFLLLLISFACSPEKREKSGNLGIVKSSFEIKLDGGISNISLGDSISVNITQTDLSTSFTSIELFMNSSLVASFSAFPVKVKIGTSELKLGKNKIKISAIENGKTRVKTYPITILSDIQPQLYSYKILNEYPHKVNSYTQGIFYHNNFLYEGTGQLGYSRLIKLNLEDGNILMKHKLDENIFGEGVAFHDGKIYQLSWTKQVGYVYNLQDFSEITRFYYEGEGWGLTSDSTFLYRSDGTNKIHRHNASDFSLNSTIEVYSDEGPITYLNELEYIDGKIYANIWHKNEIAIINRDNGKLEGLINLKGLLPKNERDGKTDVLNGIAFDAKNNRLFVTGKNWPKLYEIQIIKEI